MTPTRILFLAAAAVVSSTAAEACTPSTSDFDALAASPSHLTPGEFSALSPERQELVCSTRAFIKQIDAQKGVMNKIETYSMKYLSPAENDRIVQATNEHLFRLLKAGGH